MARIRTIKPDFWTNERVMECSMSARLLFIGMWNFADDCGRLSMSPKTLKAQILPSDDVTSENILGMLQELSENGLILTYEVDGRKYIQITGWQHQRIDKPQPAKHPAPVNGYSETVLGKVVDGREGKGEERNVSYRIPDVEDGDARARAPAISPEANRLADECAKIAGHDLAFVPPSWCGAAYRAQLWLDQGWPEDLILESVRSQAAKKRDGPVNSIHYFEPGIASAIAKAQAPVPTVIEIPAKTVEVASAIHSPNSASAAARRAEARIHERLAADGLDSEPYQPTYLRLPAR